MNIDAYVVSCNNVAFVVADCRRDIISGLIQVINFMFVSKNVITKTN